MSYIDLQKRSENPAPPEGFIRIKIGTDGMIYLIDENGVVSGPMALQPLSIPDGGVVEIASGVLSPVGMWHQVNTEGGGATDDLNTITAFAGNLLLVTAYSASNVVTLKHNVGNIFFSHETDVVLDSTTDYQLLFYDSVNSKWVNLQ